MAATLKLRTSFEVEIDGNIFTGGDPNVPQTISLAGAYLDATKVIAVSTTWDVWDAAGEEPIADFDFLYIESELDDVLVELTTDDNNGVGDEHYVIQLKKNIPFILGSDTGQANYTKDFAALTADVIDRIRIRNPDASNTATVRVFAAT